MKKILLVILCFSLCVSSISSFAAEEEELELFVDGTEIDAITDYSTYGAADVTEMSETVYTSGQSFIDVKDDVLSKKLSLLLSLGIIEMSENRKFDPDSNISRIEFLISAFRLMNYDVSVFSNLPMTYYDVPDNYEYSDYIIAAEKMNVMVGFGDMTFRPKDIITYNQIITVLLRIMGYQMPAESEGGYPYGYVTIANRLNLNKNVRAVGENAVTKGDAAVLLYNCLHSSTLSKELEGSTSKYVEGKNVLENYFDVYTTTGVIEANYIAGTGDYGRTKKDEVIIGGVKYRCKDYSYGNLIGRTVIVYYIDNSKIGLREIKHIELINEDDAIIIKADDIISYNNGTLTYYKGNRRTHVEIASNHELFFNDVKLDKYDSSIFTPQNGYLQLFRSNTAKSNEYDYVIVRSFFNYPVKSVSASGSIVTVKSSQSVTALTFDMANEDLVFELYDANGKIASELTSSIDYDADGNKITKYYAPPIPANTLISVFTDKSEKDIHGHYIISKDATYVKIYINDKKLESSLLRVDGNESVQLKEGDFELANDNFLYDEPGILDFNKKLTFYFDFDGKIAMCTSTNTESSDFVYGYLIKVRIDRKNDEHKLRILKADGKIDTISTSPKLKINGTKIKTGEELTDALQTSASMINPTFVVSQLIKYKINNDGNIYEIQTVTAPTGIAGGYSENHLHRMTNKTKYQTPQYYGGTLGAQIGISYSDGSVKTEYMSLYNKPNLVFVVPDTETFEDDDYYIERSSQNYFTGQKYFDVYDCTDQLVPMAAVKYDERKEDINPAPFIVVDRIVTLYDEEEECILYAIKGVDGGSYSTFTTENENLFNGIKKGDILFCEGFETNKITTIKKLCSVEDILNYNFNNEYERTTFTSISGTSFQFSIQEVYDYASSSRTFVLQSGPDSKGNGVRAFQRISYWSHISASFRYGTIVCNVYDNEIKFDVGSASDIKGVKDYGHTASSKIFVVEQGYMSRFFLLVNDCR